MANFFREHNTRVKSRTIISKDKLNEGMIIKCRYESQDKSGGEYILLVLDVNYKQQLHALSLNEFSSRTFINLAIYEGLLKAKMGSKYNTSYRTLDIKKMSGIMLLEYNL